ncbi:MAG: carboxypeptidase regulatory-like domain-containing protein, partial [Armatimonadetes bacterium]|nr:carboxypeptidase regulatory-like domain-containing protein [Armatimonadota bacterium]
MSRAHSLRALVVAACLIVLLVGCGGGGGKGPSLSGGFGKIIGTVTDSASVDTTRAPRSPITIEVDGTDISAEAGSDGRFALNRVPVGMHTLIARTEGRACALVVNVESDQETDVGEVVLEDAGQISGLVTSADTHKLISGALVTVAELVFTAEDEMPHPVRGCHTNASGSYTVSALPVGDYLVTISKAGYQECSLELTVEAGATTPGDAALAPDVAAETGTLSGTVYLRADSGDPTPLAGVLVRVTPKDEPVEIQPLPDDAIDEDGEVVDLYPDDDDVPPPPPLKSGDSTMPERFSDEYYAFSDENGKYTIDGIPAGEYTAMAVRPGLQPDRQPVTITVNATTTQDFILALNTPRFGVIEGTVTDTVTKAPIAGASVRAIIGRGPLLADRSPGNRGEAGEGGVISPDPGHCIMFAITDENGHYGLKVPAVARGVVVRAVGYEPRRVEISLTPGQTL